MAIQHLRKRLNLRQSDLARELGLKQNTVSQYENGRAVPGGTILAALWKMADQAERNLLKAHAAEELSFLSEGEQRAVLRSAMAGASAERALLFARFETIMRGPNVNVVVSEFLGLYLEYGNREAARRIFREALDFLCWKLSALEDSSAGKPSL